MGLRIFTGSRGTIHEIICDRCLKVSISDAPGGDYIVFRRRAGKAGWIRRHNRWLGPCCMSAQLSLDLARTAPAREISPGKHRHG
jgi:hypothetical protein